MSRRLSVGAPAGDSAAWLDGFLSGESVLLVHDPALLAIVDAWVDEIPEHVFEDLLPLLRRTFSRFQQAERRSIAEHVRRLGGGGRPGAARGRRASTSSEPGRPWRRSRSCSAWR